MPEDNTNCIDPIYSRQKTCELLGGISLRTLDRIPDEELPRVQITERRVGITDSAIRAYRARRSR